MNTDVRPTGQKLLLDMHDIIEICGISRTTAYNWLHRADMPTVRVGGRVFMHGPRFYEWIDNQTGKQEERSG